MLSQGITCEKCFQKLIPRNTRYFISCRLSYVCLGSTLQTPKVADYTDDKALMSINIDLHLDPNDLRTNPS